MKKMLKWLVITFALAIFIVIILVILSKSPSIAPFVYAVF